MVEPDDWFESEQPYATACAIELRRIRRRTAARPLLALGLAALVTAGITYRIATKAPTVEAQVVIAVSEEALADHRRSQLPAVDLRDYVSSVLLSDQRLLAIVDKYARGLRARLGDEFALSELRGQLEIEVWRNTFTYYDAYDQDARKSARIGITVADKDPDRASSLARAVADAVIAAHEEEHQIRTRALADRVGLMRAQTEAELEQLAGAVSRKDAAIRRAHDAQRPALAAALYLELTTLEHAQKVAHEQLSTIVQSREALAYEIARAGLDVSMRVVEERPPAHPERDPFELLIAIAVVGTCSLLGAALVVGAFDARIHEPEDLQRLGLPVLGHVP